MLEHQIKSGRLLPEKNTRLIFIVAISLLSVSCSSSLPSRVELEPIGVDQKLFSDGVFPDEYVFCDKEIGAWKCPDVSKKTLASHKVEALDKESPKNSGINDNAGNGDSEKSLPPSKNSLVLNERTSKFANLLPGLPDMERVGLVNFAFDVSTLDNKALSALTSLLPKLKNKQVVILGFTDRVGSVSYNNGLAYRRAESVNQFLVKNSFDPRLSKSSGRGKCCYVSNDPVKNRRVELYTVN